MRLKFTDTEIKEALKNLTIIADTREKTGHIKKWLEDNKINVLIKKIDHGDYTAMISLKGQEFWLDKDIIIEKKADIDELAGNMSKADKPRLKAELSHLNKYGITYSIFVEDENFDTNIRSGNYRSEWDPKRLYQSLKGLEAQYKTFIRPVSSEYIASEIYNTLYYFTRDLISREFYIVKDRSVALEDE